MSTIVRFFQDGGAFMIPILLVFGFGIAIAIERWTYLTMSGASNRALWKKIVPFLKAGNFQEAAQYTAKSKAAIGSILTYGLYRVKSARRRDDIEKAMADICVYCGSRSEPGGQGRHAVGVDFNSNEHNGVRTDGRYSVVADSCFAADQDECTGG